MRCPRCNTKNESGNRFCLNCGLQLPEQTQQTPPDAQQNSPNPQPVQNAPHTQPTQQLVPQPASSPAAPTATPTASAPSTSFAMSAGTRNTIIVIIVAIVAVLALLSSGVIKLSIGGHRIGGNSPSQVASSQATSGSRSSESPQECAQNPDATVTSASSGSNGTLDVEIQLESACGTQSNPYDELTTVSLSDSEGFIARAVFDFASNPVDLSSGTESTKLNYQTTQYWRPADEINTNDVKVALVLNPSTASGSEPSNSGDTRYGADIADSEWLEDTAKTAINRQIKHDKSTAQNFMNTYTNQLSSKQKGMVADGKTWSYRDIYEQYLQMRTRFSNTLLVWSGDWPTYTKNNTDNYYVLLSGEGFSSPDGAQSWCTSNGFSSDDCIPVNLS